MHSLTSCVILMIVIWVLALCIVWWLQYRILFYPSREIVWTPEGNYQEFFLTFDNKISSEQPKKGEYLWVWRFIQDPQAKTVLFCHGNSGNISHREYMLNFCRLFGLNLILFDYRGYGRSSGYSNIGTLHQDADLIREYIDANVELDKLIIWGESLGGALATYIATKCKCHRLVLMATFSSLDDILVYKEIRFANAISQVLRLLINTMPSKDRIININCPIVVAHSVEDELIPYACSEKLFSNIRGEKLFIPMRGGHASPILRTDDVRLMMEFLGVSMYHIRDDEIQKSLDEIQTVTQRYGL